jgi:hypothetical protein
MMEDNNKKDEKNNEKSEKDRQRELEAMLKSLGIPKNAVVIGDNYTPTHFTPTGVVEIDVH